MRPPPLPIIVISRSRRSRQGKGSNPPRRDAEDRTRRMSTAVAAGSPPAARRNRTPRDIGQYHLAVDDRRLARLRGDRCVAVCPVVAAPGEGLYASVLQDDLGAVPVPFDFMGPFAARRWLIDNGWLHRFDEPQRTAFTPLTHNARRWNLSRRDIRRWRGRFNHRAHSTCCALEGTFRRRPSSETLRQPGHDPATPRAQQIAVAAATECMMEKCCVFAK